MKDIKSILSTKYENSNEILELLSKFELENIISNAIEKIEMKIKIKDFEELPKISGIILNEINSKIKNVKDDTEKRKLEYFMSDSVLRSLLASQGYVVASGNPRSRSSPHPLSFCSRSSPHPLSICSRSHLCEPRGFPCSLFAGTVPCFGFPLAPTQLPAPISLGAVGSIPHALDFTREFVGH